MARILIYNNDTVYAKRHINYKDEIDTFFITANVVMTGGVFNG